MPVVLNSQKSDVVDALRAARNADDEFSRVKENSWENYRNGVARLVESVNWKYGPAELLATFDHHLLAKSPGGELVQVEWSRDKEGKFELGRAVVHETATPVADLGRELMETAKAAVDMILDEDLDAAQPMLSTISEALDTGGDLQRRVNNEITIRSLTRNAWWHGVVGEREGIEAKIPTPHVEGDDALGRSTNDLLLFLKEAAGEASTALRKLADSEIAKDVETLARDVAEDTERAISALVGINVDKQDEALQVYEAVMAAMPRLLNGLEFLRELTQADEPTTDSKG